MYQILVLNDEITARRIGEFLTGPHAFDQEWAPNEKANVQKAPMDSLKNPKHQYWYIEGRGQIIGAIGVRENKYGSGGYEMDADYVAIHQDYRKQGLASQLLQKVEEFVQQNHGRYLHILSCDIPSYAAARGFYQKHGYRKVAEIPNYYVEGEGRVDYLKEFQVV
jgi:ribosomal protein S18 acetylase RimI-like enzyme